MRANWRLLALLPLVLSLALVACGRSIATGHPSASVARGRCPASAGLPSNLSDHGAVSASNTRVAIEANDFFFSPTCVTGVPGDAITLTVHNVGQALHNVSIPALDIDIDVSPGQTIMIHIQMRNAPLVFFCKYHKGAGMYGALLVLGAALRRGCCCRPGAGCAPVATT